MSAIETTTSAQSMPTAATSAATLTNATQAAQVERNANGTSESDADAGDDFGSTILAQGFAAMIAAATKGDKDENAEEKEDILPVVGVETKKDASSDPGLDSALLALMQAQQAAAQAEQPKDTQLTLATAGIGEEEPTIQAETILQAPKTNQEKLSKALDAKELALAASEEALHDQRHPAQDAANLGHHREEAAAASAESPNSAALKHLDASQSTQGTESSPATGDASPAVEAVTPSEHSLGSESGARGDEKNREGQAQDDQSTTTLLNLSGSTSQASNSSGAFEQQAGLAALGDVKPHSETTATAQASQGDMPQLDSHETAQSAAPIFERVKILTDEGGGTAKIDLNPEHLGKLTIEIRVENNQVHATLTSETEEARKLLEDHADELRKQLEERNLKLESWSLNTQAGNQGEEQRRDLYRDYEDMKFYVEHSAGSLNAADTQTPYAANPAYHTPPAQRGVDIVV